MLVHNLAGMCGIVGILKLDRRETPDGARLKRMRDMLRHRSPDGEGLWIDGPVGLGHRRLSIVDVAGGPQPMSNEDGAVWITYNGEIYNHAALRPRLEPKGRCYQTRRDTETILHLYEEACQRPPQHPSTAPRRRGRNLVAEPHCRILRCT
jgi:asparagine synthase (glutamine-hydrolysing)